MSVYMYGAGLCMWVQVHSEARRGRQIPQSGVPSVVSSLVLDTKLWSSRRAMCALSH